MSISKQRFYEELILKSYENSYGTVFEHEAEVLKTMMDWPPESFPELLVKRSVCGFKGDIPEKQPFDKLGFSYLAQVIGFVVRTDDDDLTYDFFEFLEKVKDNKKIIDPKDEEHAGLLYEAFYDTFLVHHSSFADKMADFILLNCEGTEAHGKTLSLVYATGRSNVDLHDLVAMKKRQVRNRLTMKGVFEREEVA